MTSYLNSDVSFFDDQLFYFFRQKYKPSVIHYLNEKHYFESINKQDVEIKRINLFIWNGLLVQEIIKLGYTIVHLEKHYDGIYKKIKTAKSLTQLHKHEIDMFSKYIDIIINQQESTDHLLVNKILHYMYIHLEEPLSLKKITADLNVSQSYASKVFKENMNMTIIKHSKFLKIERAKALLKTNESITHIGERLGFYDQAHFSRTFKSFTGMSPQNYKIKDV